MLRHHPAPASRRAPRPLALGALLALALLAACTTEPTPPPAAPTPSSPPTAAPATATTAPTIPSTATARAATATALPTLAPTLAPSATPVPPSPTRPPPTATPPAPPTATTVPPSATPRPPSATPAPPRPTPARPAPPATAAPSGPVLLATGFGAPDDVAVDPRTGTIYFGDFGNGAINRVAPGGGKPVVVASGLRDPEGIVVLPDGALIVMEQTTNRLLHVDPQTGTHSLLRQLQNNTGQDGVDGISLDPTTGRVLIPDSPNGRLLSMLPDGSDLRTLATGFTRPTGAARLPNGDLIVADEFGNALDRVSPGGKISPIVSIFQPDDVVVDAQGIAYANSLGGTIYRVDPATGRRTVLLAGLQLPHGLALDPQGQLIIAEATRNRVFRLAP